MIFVFGSNEQGQHGGGAARDAKNNHGAIWGQGFGAQGNSFGIPTCALSTSQPNFNITRDKLQYYIWCFILWAKMNPNETFKVTRVGCGLAGWSDEVVAPMFKDAPLNCLFDSAWDTPNLLPGRTYWGTFGDFPAPAAKLDAPYIDASTNALDGIAL